MALWQGYPRVILVDAMRSGRPPGSLHWFSAQAPPPAGIFPYATHRFGLVEALRLGALLGELPGELYVLGIEGACFDAGAPLSPAVAEAVERAAGEVLAVLSTAPREDPRSASR